MIQDLAIARERQKADHDRDVWLAWFTERFARTDKLGLPNDYLIHKIEPPRKPRVQPMAEMRSAMQSIAAALHGRG